jgi:hypothetical protein
MAPTRTEAAMAPLAGHEGPSLIPPLNGRARAAGAAGDPMNQVGSAPVNIQ